MGQKKLSKLAELIQVAGRLGLAVGIGAEGEYVIGDGSSTLFAGSLASTACYLEGYGDGARIFTGSK